MPRFAFLSGNHALAWSLFVFIVGSARCAVADFERDARPLLLNYCCGCHSGDAPNGDVDFERITTPDDIVEHFGDLERARTHLMAGTMPPDGEEAPDDASRTAFLRWYDDYVSSVVATPAVFRPRRLSVNEYRNTLHSVLGFELEVTIIEAEQTLSERSLVVKLLPTDPPGRSGFTNDTHRNRLSQVAWDQYAYLADTGLERLFSPTRREQLQQLTGEFAGELGQAQVPALIRTMLERTRRRPVAAADVETIVGRVAGKHGTELEAALKLELKVLLMSPAFLYRGLLARAGREGRAPVDDHELAERLSYFLWADAPDAGLHRDAAEGRLHSAVVLAGHVDRMLADPRARSLVEIFGTEWFLLDEIEHVSNNPPQMLALKSQPLDFLHYLFTENRPLLELLDSETAFINPHTARMYGADARQMTRYVKQRGIEVEAVPNQRIQLRETTSRGGLLTMAGVLAMNKGPIQRGTWILERIMGDELPEPPADVGVVPPNRGGAELTFRQRFEQHRSEPTCAVCHDRIDPLGFALQTYDARGQFIRRKGYKPNRRDVRQGLVAASPEATIDTTGRLPTGEEFADVSGLKEILRTSQRRVVIRNFVERTMSYALCRELMIYDRPTVESIVEKVDRPDATWRDLFVAVVTSVPFTEAVFQR